MEPNIIKKDNYQKKVLVLSILCMVVLLLSSSYAIMTNFSQKEDAITFSTGNLEMTILNGEETFSLINLNLFNNIMTLPVVKFVSMGGGHSK